MIAKISAAIGIIGAADGPTTLYVANYFKLEKFIAPFRWRPTATCRWCRSSSRRSSARDHQGRASDPHGLPLGREPRVQDHADPAAHRGDGVAGIIVPMSVPLVGSLMFGHLIRDVRRAGAAERDGAEGAGQSGHDSAGLTIGSTMVADRFLRFDTLLILALGFWPLCSTPPAACCSPNS
jgi:oxaloacetate decarboxylase beta subunit